MRIFMLGVKMLLEGPEEEPRQGSSIFSTEKKMGNENKKMSEVGIGKSCKSMVS